MLTIKVIITTKVQHNKFVNNSFPKKKKDSVVACHVPLPILSYIPSRFYDWDGTEVGYLANFLAFQRGAV